MLLVELSTQPRSTPWHQASCPSWLPYLRAGHPPSYKTTLCFCDPFLLPDSHSQAVIEGLSVLELSLVHGLSLHLPFTIHTSRYSSFTGYNRSPHCSLSLTSSHPPCWPRITSLKCIYHPIAVLLKIPNVQSKAFEIKYCNLLKRNVTSSQYSICLLFLHIPLRVSLSVFWEDRYVSGTHPLGRMTTCRYNFYYPSLTYSRISKIYSIQQ